jgi:hypothetical protein
MVPRDRVTFDMDRNYAIAGLNPLQAKEGTLRVKMELARDPKLLELFPHHATA